MLNVNEMTLQQAVLGALVLALTADTEENCKMAGDLADNIVGGLSDAEISQCKDMAIEIRGLAMDLHWALAPHDVASLVAGTCGISALDDGNSLLVFEIESDRDAFVSDQEKAEVPEIYLVCADLTERYQRKLVAKKDPGEPAPSRI